MSNVRAYVEPKRKVLPVSTSGSYNPTVTTNVVSESVAVESYKTIGLQVNVTSAAGLTADISVEVSIDGTNFGTYPGSSVAVTGNDVIPFNLADCAFCYLRVRSNVSAGSCAVEIWISAKAM